MSDISKENSFFCLVIFMTLSSGVIKGEIKFKTYFHTFLNMDISHNIVATKIKTLVFILCKKNR